MAKNKPAKKKEKSKADRIPIITAAIAAIAVVVGAAINIFPNLIAINSQKEIPTVTPATYIKYDDPLGMYSIYLPPDLVVASRDSSGSYSITLLVPKEYSSKAEINFSTIDVYSLIMVAVQKSPVTTEDVEKFNEQILNGVVQQNSPNVGSLVFNQKTSKGFFMKYKTVDLEPSRFTYIFGEWDKNTFGVVIFSVLESSDTSYSDSVSYATSNFVWYPSKIIEYLKP